MKSLSVYNFENKLDTIEEIEETLPEFEIIVGTNDAYLISDFVKTLNY